MMHRINERAVADDAAENRQIRDGEQSLGVPLLMPPVEERGQRERNSGGELLHSSADKGMRAASHAPLFDGADRPHQPAELHQEEAAQHGLYGHAARSPRHQKSYPRP